MIHRSPSTPFAPGLLKFLALTLLALPATTLLLRADDQPPLAPPVSETPAVDAKATALPPPSADAPAAATVAFKAPQPEAGPGETMPPGAPPAASSAPSKTGLTVSAEPAPPTSLPDAKGSVPAPAEPKVAEVPVVGSAPNGQKSAAPPTGELKSAGPTVTVAETKPAGAALVETKATGAPSVPSTATAPKPVEPAPAATKSPGPALTAAAHAAPTTGQPQELAIPVPAALADPRHQRPLAPPSLSAKEAQGLDNLGVSLTERGDFDAAEIAYRQVLNGHAPVEQTKSALLGLAHMHRKQGYLTKAAAIYERYLKDYPNDDRVPDALLDLGRTLRDMGAPRLAIASFYNVINSTLKLSASAGFAHYQLLAKTAQFEVAETHFEAGEYAEATKFYSRLRMLDLAPADRARAHFKSAYSLQLAGDLEGAVTSLRAYLEQWPDDENVPEARYLLATSLRTLKRTQESLSATIDLLMMEKKRTANDPKRWNYWQRRTGNQLANDFFQGGDIVNALVIYKALATLSDDPAWRIPVTYQIALCYERLSDLERACATYRSIVESAGPTPVPAVADTARMASSRLAHIDWHEATDRQVSALFDSTTGKLNPITPKAAPSHDSDRSPASASPAL